jgi:octaprenyl-diphosphate synthase
MYKEIRSVVEKDFQAVNQHIIEQLHSDVPLVENIGHYIVEAGGKRLRPVLVLLSAKSCGLNSQQHIPLATVIEFIHTATLLHDDVVDMSTLRRGRPTVNSEWNNPSSVLVGDFLYSRAFQILVNIGNMRIMEIIADTTNKIAEAEVLQLINKHNPEASESNYMNVIRNKTAILFQAAAHCGGILADANAPSQDSLQRYGMHLGMAFQLIDDALDYDGDSDAMGKNIGDDLTEGKPTLPLIYAMAHGSSEQASLIEQCLNTEKLPDNSLQQVLEIVRQTGALDYTRQIAESESAKALDCLEQLPASEYRDALAALARFAVNRRN